MSAEERKTIEIPEICRVEGHSAVHVDIAGTEVTNVTLDVFEGTRFFEKIVLGHHFEEMPHITSRVCAICSTGHVLAAINAVERCLKFKPPHLVWLFRELMHLGMIIESHATHIYALALPDYVGVCDLVEFATKRSGEFETWTKLRNLGAAIQTTVGGRPFHPVNLQVGGFSRFPALEELNLLKDKLSEGAHLALRTCELLLSFKPPVARTTTPVFVALIPHGTGYGYFGDTVQSSDNWQDSIDNYRQYLGELSVPYSHAKRSSARGKPLMVGSMARLHLFSDRLAGQARSIFQASPLNEGDTNSLWNNLAQAIELVEAVDRCRAIIATIAGQFEESPSPESLTRQMPAANSSSGAVECPRGTLYHYYSLDGEGRIVEADMITPSAQNTARIELDIREVVNQAGGLPSESLTQNLETLVRAYDPCNTCATHMVSVRFS